MGEAIMPLKSTSIMPLKIHLSAEHFARSVINARRITYAKVLPSFLRERGINPKEMTLTGAISVHAAITAQEKRLSNYKEFASIILEVAHKRIDNKDLRNFIANEVINKMDIFIRIKEYILYQDGDVKLSDKEPWLKPGYKDRRSKFEIKIPATGSIKEALRERAPIFVEKDANNPNPYITLPLGSGFLKFDCMPLDNLSEAERKYIVEQVRDFKLLFEVLSSVAMLKALESTVETSLDAIANKKQELVGKILADGISEMLGYDIGMVFGYSDGMIQEIAHFEGSPYIPDYKEPRAPEGEFKKAISSLKTQVVSNDPTNPYMIVPLKIKETLSGIMVIFSRIKDDQINPRDIAYAEALGSIGGMVLRLQKSEEIIQDALTKLHHDLAEPLFTIAGFTTNLLVNIKEGNYSEKDFSASLKRIGAAEQKASDILKQLQKSLRI